MYIYIYLYRCNHPLFFFSFLLAQAYVHAVQNVSSHTGHYHAPKTTQRYDQLLGLQHIDHSYLGTHSLLTFLAFRCDKKNTATANLSISISNSIRNRPTQCYSIH